MAKTVENVKVPAKSEGNFPISIGSFLNEISDRMIETKRSFKWVIGKENMASKFLLQKEWQNLFDLYKTKPSGISFTNWIKKGGK